MTIRSGRPEFWVHSNSINYTSHDLCKLCQNVTLGYFEVNNNLQQRCVCFTEQLRQPPPEATPAHVLRLLPAETPLPRIASSVARSCGTLPVG